jgi:hypothetical protein
VEAQMRPALVVVNGMNLLCRAHMGFPARIRNRAGIDITAPFGSSGAARVITNLGRYQGTKHLHWHVVSGSHISDPVELDDPSWRPWRRPARPVRRSTERSEAVPAACPLRARKGVEIGGSHGHRRSNVRGAFARSDLRCEICEWG